MRRAIGVVVVIVLVAGAWVLALPPSALHQPIAFPHAKHHAVGCTVCHRGAPTSARAGIPDISFCAKCHATAPAGTGAAWDAAVAAQAIRWVPVTTLPAHVMFSHRRHVTLARLDCESCHGDMGARRTPPGAEPVRLVMTTCLSCHRHEGAAEDCAACHR